MSTSIQADPQFQIFIETFADAFGIQNPEELKTQKRKIIPEFVQIDAVVSFGDDFDFTSLSDRIFPFLGRYNILECKGENDALSVMRLYQYSLTELGIITTHLLSKKRKDRKEHQSLSQKNAIAQWVHLQSQGAIHTCCTVILSTADPKGLRERAKFKAIADYPHLEGALYRRTIIEDTFVGSAAIYLIVLNDLPIHSKNAPLLLLSKGKKLNEFYQWLVDDSDEISLEERQDYLFYPFRYDLVQGLEEMKKKYHTKLIGLKKIYSFC